MPDTWGAALQAAYCSNCDWHYLLPQGQALPQCPHCARSVLEQLDDSAGGFNQPPEMVVPFAVAKESYRHSRLVLRGHNPGWHFRAR